jgi:ABC-type lipoprotein release transport system permease subunit
LPWGDFEQSALRHKSLQSVVTLAAVMVLGLSALVASLIPAFRASLISPLDALRAE